MRHPKLNNARSLSSNKKRLLICAYGFEDRALGWTEFQIKKNAIDSIDTVFVVKYVNPKGKNKIRHLRNNFKKLGVKNIVEFEYDVNTVENIEFIFEKIFNQLIQNFDEIILDITPLTKFLILIFLSKLELFEGALRIVYSEARDYSPSKAEFQKWKDSMRSIATFPSKGFGTILRAKCLSSIRMQGQPVTLVAFASFNEQLLRYLLGSITPYRLLFINGRPPRSKFSWREFATQYIHRRLISEYHEENQLDANGLLRRSSSTLDYEETIKIIGEIHRKYADYERMIIAATGSKMQTVGLYFSKKIFPDIHIEYPTPDSYYVPGFSTKVHKVFEMNIHGFRDYVERLSENRTQKTLN